MLNRVMRLIVAPGAKRNEEAVCGANLTGASKGRCDPNRECSVSQWEKTGSILRSGSPPGSVVSRC